MKQHNPNELPIRSKYEMIHAIIKIIHFLHAGKKKEANELIEELKIRAIHLDPPIQQDVLIFAEQIQFQYAYDPWHKVTEEIQKAADRLIEDLGFSVPSTDR